MPYIKQITVNVNTKEVLGEEIIGEADECESPMPDVVQYLADKWNKEHPDEEPNNSIT